MNGEVCCILQVCCPPARAKKALADEFVRVGIPSEHAKTAAELTIDNFDLAPKGLLQPLLSKAGELARAHPHE